MKELKDITTVMVVGDQKPYIDMLQALLGELPVKQVIIGVKDFENAQDAFVDIQPDICILDVELSWGEVTGIQLAQQLRYISSSCAIIFLSSRFTEEYYQAAKETWPSAFLDKDINRIKLHAAMELALLAAPQKSPETLDSAATRYKKVFIRISDRYKAVEPDQVAYFFTENRITYARREGKKFATSVQLLTLEKELHPNFVRIHKAFLVNVNSIDSIDPKAGKVEIGSERLPIGYAYRRQFFELVRVLK